MKRLILSLSIFLVSFSLVRADEAPEKAICKIQWGLRYPSGRVAYSLGTGTVIGPKRADGKWLILTARHVVHDLRAGVTAKKLTIDQGDERFTAGVVATNDAADLAWLITDKSDLKLPYALLAEKAPEEGREIWHNGFSPYRPQGKQTGRISADRYAGGIVGGKIVMHFGDSGCGMFCAESGRVLFVLLGGTSPHACGGGCLAAAKIRPKE